MLEFVPSSPKGENNRLAMDLSQYLLSASPPGLGFDLRSLSLHHPPHLPTHFSSSSSVTCSSQSYSFSQSNDNFYQFHNNNIQNQENNKRSGELKSIIICSSNWSSCDSEESSSLSERSQSPGRSSKKVSFADHKGLALAQVRLVKEGPDEPPQLNSKILSWITQGANAGIESNPPIKLCFPQPASDYMAFRDKVMHNLVSLENVILHDYSIKGTIKVKNITFEKKVFVRVSIDHWESFEDYPANYVTGPGKSANEPIDTFSFQVEISPSFDVSKKIQFAVCFEEYGRQHWDNNNGCNYCIISDSYDDSLNNFMPLPVNERWLPEKSTDSWSEFSAWRDVGCSGRFY